ncbi:MAG: hypothetical protein M0T84_08585 [Betaproteobacteria bacterium]|nr:hypothetical protein [Betaproteobacteria bacterium]
MATKQVLPKLYIVNFGDKEHLVRAYTQSGAATGLVRSMMDAARTNTRLATQDELFEMAGRGVKPIDVTASDKDGGEGERAGAAGEAGGQ